MGIPRVKSTAQVRVLVIDIGGSSVKYAIPGARKKGAFPSGTELGPQRMVECLMEKTSGWRYEAVSVGFPGTVIHGEPAGEPPKLGKGWLGFDFAAHFKKPVKIMNDAAMQALGSYRGGRMLFVGLGSGLGSALILDDIIVPLELGELSDSRGRKLGDVLGKEALAKSGLSTWRRSLLEIIPRFAAAFRTDYIVVGGGSARLLPKLPAGARPGSNDLAFAGGARLWNSAIRHVKHTWIMA